MQRMMGRALATAAVLATVVGLSGPARATSFSFGTIGPSDEIASIVLAPKSGGVPLLSFDANTGVMTFQADVATITLVGGTVFNPTAGAVDFSMSTIMLQSGSEQFTPNPFPTSIGGEFHNGFTFDFALTDVAGGSVVMLESEFFAPLVWDVTQVFYGIVNGNLAGDFDVVGGDGDFVSAWGLTGGSFDAQMTSFLANGLAVNQACELTSSGGTAGLSCYGVAADGFTNWTSNPVVTLQPTGTAIPEPSAAVLVVLALGAAAGCRIKR